MTIKNIKIGSGILLLALMAACSKEVELDLNVTDAQKYTMVYMPQANQNAVEKGLSITDSIETVLYSAFLGGSLDNNSNVDVKFSVLPELVDTFNLKNETQYALMPAGSYELEAESAQITAGKKSTPPLRIKIKSKGYLDPFVTYLLPVGIVSAGEKVNQKLSKAYYLITGSYAPGEVPRQKVYSFGAGTSPKLFALGDDLMQMTSTGDLLFYNAQSDGIFAAPVKKGQGWNIFDMVFPFRNSRLIARYAADGQNIVQYIVDQDGNVGASQIIGYGWGIFKKIIPFRGMLLGLNDAGGMTMYPLSPEGAFDGANIRPIGQGWGGFRHIIPYQESLLVIENNGDMYQYPLSDQGSFGARKKLGSGWDMYTDVVAVGTDLVAVDAQGDLWRYKFSTLGLWPLK